MAVDRRRFASLAAFAGVAGLARIGRAAAQAPIRLNMGSAMPPSHPITTALVEAVENIREETGGRIEIAFFPNSQLGSELSMQSQLRSGALEFTATSVSSLQTLAPTVGLPGVAFAFNGYAELWKALDEGALGEDARAALAKLGVKAFRVLDNGFRHVITGAAQIRTVADLDGLKIRVPPSQLLTSLFKVLGASPTTINLAETYAALQTRVADGMENSLPNIEATRVYEVQKFIARTRHSWDGLWILANQAAWDGLPPADRAIITHHFDRATDRQRRDFLAMEASSEDRLKAQGITFTEPDREAFRAALLKAGYYADWKQKFGQAAWANLERYTGSLGT